MDLDDYAIRHPDGAELQFATASADWIADRLLPPRRDAGMRACSIVPNGYAAYVRIFHQVREYVGETWVPRRWSEIAESNGRVMHPCVQFERLGSSGQRRVGTLVRDEADSLIAILRYHSVAADACWLATWDGWAWFSGGAAIGVMTVERPKRFWWARKGNRSRLEPPRDLRRAPKLSLPWRKYYVYRASIDVVPHFEFLRGQLQTPNLWWPDDRAWFVGTEIDSDSTIVACSRACADALLASSLEVLEVLPDSRLDINGDTLNDPEHT